MTDWQWFVDSESDAIRRGDHHKARLMQIHRDAFACRETAPDRTLALFAEGRRLAEQLREPWWVLLYDHWHVHGLLYYKWDYNDVLGPAVANTLAASRPENAEFPQRLRIYGDLTTAYMGIDPVGYAEQVEETLDFLETLLPEEWDAPHYMTLEQRIWLAMARGKTDDALQLALRNLARAEGDSNRHNAGHYIIEGYMRLCQIGYCKKDWLALQSWALAGEEAARNRNHERAIVCFQLWQALLAMDAGRKPQARRLYNTARARMQRLRSPAFSGYYEAVCGYHECDGKPEEALGAREQELQTIRGRGMLAYESSIHLERCRLLVRLGTLQEADVVDARAAASRLRFPESRLQELDRLARGEGPPPSGESRPSPEG